MGKIILVSTWDEFKAVLTNKNVRIQKESENSTHVNVFTMDGDVEYRYAVEKGTADETDYNTHYSSECCKSILQRNVDGKPSLVASSRPPGTVTMFTMRGDTTNIGDGKIMAWDFSNTDDDVTPPTGYKKKKIEVTFHDNVWVKEGTIYFHNSPKGCYGDLKIICPSGQYYLNDSGVPTLATEDTVVSHYVNHHLMQGSCPMGAQLNTEEAQEKPIPPNYKIWIEVTTPDTDSTSNGYVSMEVYREKTV